MKSKKKSLLNSRLYLILDKNACPGRNAVKTFGRLGRGEIDIVQLRENAACDREFLKDAEIIRRLSWKHGIIYIVNNRPDIALLADADGLHLGQSDLTLEAARRLLGKNKILGVSCHNLAQALKAQSEGADYIGIGPVFKTPTKPDLVPINLNLLRAVNQKISIPSFAIGGIDKGNIKTAMSYGAKRFAVCRAICRAKNVKKAIFELRNKINDDPD
ncbi:MAG: thiamine phosphate synthase [Candidatus Omnitrophota bacterium]